MKGLVTLLYVEDDGFRSQVEQALEDSGRAHRIEQPRDLAQLVHQLGNTRFDAVFVELGEKPAELLEVLERLPEPQPALLLAGTKSDSETLVRAMRLRPDTFIVDREIGELPAVLERIDLERSGRRDAHGVIAVTGAKGGVGTTLLACELAADLQRRGDRVVVVDVGQYQGDVALYFDLTPAYSLADIARKGEHLDAEFLATVSAPHASGLHVLAAPRQPEDARLIAPAHIERTLRYLRREYDWVVLDVPQHWTGAALKALDLADMIVLVTTLEVPSLTHARQRLELLDRLGAPESHVRVVVNRAKTGDLGGWDFEKVLGRKPDAAIPSEYEVTLAGINAGRLVHEVAPNGPLALAFEGLAAAVCRWFDLEPAESRRAASLARRIGNRIKDFRHTMKGSRHGIAE